MASFVAHGLAGYLTARALGVRGWALTGYSLLAWAPDLDMLLGFVLAGDWHAYHRAWWSHSPAVAVFGAAAVLLVQAAIAALPGRRLQPRVAVHGALVVALVLLTHVVIDFVLINPVPGLLESDAASTVPAVALSLLALLSDALVYGSLALVAWLLGRRLRHRPAAPRHFLRAIRP